MKTPTFCFALLTICAFSVLRADEPAGYHLTTVFSTVQNGFQRPTREDGTLKPVNYVFGEGSFTDGKSTDASLTAMPFKQLVPLLAAALGENGFVPSLNKAGLDEVIVVHWGRTTGWDNASQTSSTAPLGYVANDSLPANPLGQPQVGTSPGSDQSLSDQSLNQALDDNQVRDAFNVRNAKLLGYVSDIDEMGGTPGPMAARRHDLVSELEGDRYYVVLVAYDFQAMRKKEKKVLWVTRFSLAADESGFDKAVAGMIKAAAPYFGQASGRVRHERIQTGHVTPGEIKVIKLDEPAKP